MRNLLFIIMLFAVLFSSANEFEKGMFQIKLKSDTGKPSIIKTDEKLTDNDKLNKIFKKHLVTSYEQSFPFAKNPELLNIYRIKIKGDDVKFKKEIQDNASDLISQIYQIPVPIPTYEPSDYMWYVPTQQDPNGWLWHLKRIQAANAWDITKSNSNIKIADVDTDFDILHPDLSSKISPNYDPMDFTVHSARGSSHGTTTASFAAAQTDGGGQLASSGFNSSLIAYNWTLGVEKAHHASFVMHADIITISWYSDCNRNYLAFHDDSIAIKEILDNGTIIVTAAANGPIDCGGKEVYPFSPLVDSRIICVTSTGIDDKHQFINNGVDMTHSGYPSVTVCAPGYLVMGAKPSLLDDGTPSPWPYYGGCTGTSFATPIVAGVCALMKSIDPCLTPTLAKSIIQANADPVLDASLYPGKLGAGRINAYKCVMATGTKSKSGSIGGTVTYTAGYAANLNNVTIQSNAVITIKARKEINITGTFDAPVGSSINFLPDVNSVNSCNW